MLRRPPDARATRWRSDTAANFVRDLDPDPVSTMPRLGEFELLVLLAILRQKDAPYANRVREDLEVNASRRVTRGAFYRTIDRLAQKGFLEWELEPSQVPERGGHPMRRLRVTEAGLAAAREARDVLSTFFEGLGPALEGR